LIGCAVDARFAVAVAADTTLTGVPADSPLTVAVTVAFPAATAVTVPLAVTVATAEFDVVHVMGEFVTVCPEAFVATAAMATWPPTFTVTAAGEMLIAVGGPDGAEAVAVEEGPVSGWPVVQATTRPVHA
jgi:hypothetical protein